MGRQNGGRAQGETALERAVVGRWSLMVPAVSVPVASSNEFGSITQFRGDLDVVSVSVIERSAGMDGLDAAEVAAGMSSRLVRHAEHRLSFPETEEVPLLEDGGGAVQRLTGEMEGLPVVQYIAGRADGEGAIVLLDVVGRDSVRGQELAETIVRSFGSVTAV